jgi:hypothetical protein
MQRSFLIGIFLILFPAMQAQKDPDSQIGGYLFAHMTSDDYGRLYYSISPDGLEWTLLNDGKSVSEEYRGHPDICQGHDGRFYQIGVEEKTEKVILWSSEDLLEWKREKFLPDDLFRNTPGHRSNPSWFGAPKTFYDPSTRKYLISWHAPEEGIPKEDFTSYWCSMRTFFVTTGDFESFTKPRRLFSFEMGTIDVIVRKEGDLYYALIKDECEATATWPTGKSIRVCVSEHLVGPYSYPGDKISPSYREAPTVIPLPEGGWYMYFEQYPGVEYEAAQAPSLSGPWYDVYAMRVKMPEKARHGCMIPLSEEQYRHILGKFGSR